MQLRTFVLIASVSMLSFGLASCEPDEAVEEVLMGIEGDTNATPDKNGVEEESDYVDEDFRNEKIDENSSNADISDETNEEQIDEKDAPLIPETTGPVAVDLGLSVKWASCNVGANSPEEYGDYFAWGETEAKSNYNSSSSLTYGLSLSKLKSRGIVDDNGILTASYDAATVNWGDNWRMPTLDEINELVEKCTWEWDKDGKGRKVIGPNGNFIFLPAAGCRVGSSPYGVGSHGHYWVASPYVDSGYAYDIYLYSDLYGCDKFECYYGFTVRPVSE